jgi:hypothetical protein
MVRSADFAGTFDRGTDAPKPEGERQTPPDYSGTGNVTVERLNGYRYWRFDGTGNQIEHTGRVSCNPDEAVQLVGTGAASYV